MFWKKKTNPSEIIINITNAIEIRFIQIYDVVVELATTQNSQIKSETVGLNLMTSLYSLALVGAERELGRSKNFGVLQTMFVAHLGAFLKTRGMANSFNVAAMAIEGQTEMFMADASQASHPIYGLAHAFVEMVSSSESPDSEAVYRAVAILTPVMADVAREVKGKRI